jgi:hypothetical protein
MDLLDGQAIETALRALGQELARRRTTGEILIAGGAWMVLLTGSRVVTRDVDAYLGPPADVIRQAAGAVAATLGLPPDWLNDAIKGFFYRQPPQQLIREYPGLRVYAVAADYMLALKALAMREQDRGDLQVLIRLLGLSTPEEAMAIVDQYIPADLQRPGLRYFVESAFADGGDAP